MVKRFFLEDPRGLPYSGDYLYLTLEALAMKEKGNSEELIESSLRSEADRLRKIARIYPSIGIEIEVWEPFIKSGYFTREEALILSAALGINTDDDGIVEFSLPPTSDYRGQTAIVDFLKRFGLIPEGIFPLHVNLGLMDNHFSEEDSLYEAVYYFGYPLALLYSPDIRLLGDGTGAYNDYGDIVRPTGRFFPQERRDVEKVFLRFEMRALSLTTDNVPEHSRGMFMSSEPYNAFSGLLRDAQTLGVLIRDYGTQFQVHSDPYEQVRLEHQKRIEAFLWFIWV
jgi:hypothetical protein